MTFNKYYQDELSFLREMGREFSQAYPSAAQFLADRGSDPDVERLLEGFAFLTGRIRQKLDDEFPELVHALMNLLWPHYLRPIPCISMVEFSPIRGAVRDHQRISRGVEVSSIPVEGTACRFRTAYELDLFPMGLEDATILELPSGQTCLRIRLELHPGIKASQLNLDKLRFHLFGEPAYPLYIWLSRYVAEVKLRCFSKGAIEVDRTLGTAIRPVGFDREEALIPYPKTSFDGYRLLQEYFSYPEKFLFMELSDLGTCLRSSSGDRLELDLVFTKPPSQTLRVSRENIRLYCTPVINLFEMESDPIRVSHERIEYLVRPSGGMPTHYEIYSIDKAYGWIRGTAEERLYEPFYSFKHGPGSVGRKEAYYQSHLRNAVIGEGTDTYVSFVNSEQSTMLPPTETVVFKLTVTNRILPTKLRVGDIQVQTDSSPEFATFRNLTKLSPTIHPMIGGDHYWRLISHLSLNYMSLQSTEALRGILGLYNLQSLYDQQAARANERRLSGIVNLHSRGQSLLFHGAPIRGTETQVDLREDHFSGEGDMFLFASVLNEFLSLYVSINSFHKMTVKGVQQGEVYQWTPRMGQQVLL